MSQFLKYKFLKNLTRKQNSLNMSIFWWILSILYLAWVYLFLTFVIKKTYNEEIQAYKNLPEHITKKYYMFIRPNIEKLDKNKLSMILCGLTITPIRIFLWIFFYIIWFIVITIVFFGSNPQKPLPAWKRFFAEKITNLFSWLILANFGCWKNIQKKWISDYDPDYPRDKENTTKNPVVIISNHIGILELFYQGCTSAPQFIAKWETQFLPFPFGQVITLQQTLFIKRGQTKTAEGKEKLSNLITERLNEIEREETFPPMCIYPEGTVSNTQALLTFKKGAFKDFKPMKINVLKFDKYFFRTVTLFCTNWINYLEIIEFRDILDPAYLNIDQNKPDAWKMYAEKARDLMSKASGIPKCGFGYRDLKKFGVVYKEELRKCQGKSFDKDK